MIDAWTPRNPQPAPGVVVFAALSAGRVIGERIVRRRPVFMPTTLVIDPRHWQGRGCGVSGR